MSELIDDVSVEELERRMRPGSWSQEGFLTPEQSLVQVMSADAASLQQYGVTATQIADSIERLLKRGAYSDRFGPAEVEQFRVRIIRSRKMRTCPWASTQFEWCHVGRGVKYLTTEDFEIANLRLGERLSGTSLYVHLIRDHGFFGGPGTQFRIDPAKAVRVLDLVSHANNEKSPEAVDL